MTELKINPVFQDVRCNFGDQVFSTMYFGRHCGKNLLILKHELTEMLVFEEFNQWLTPEFIKPVYFKCNPAKGIKIVGNDNNILMLGECGNLWMLSNAFDFSDEKYNCLHSLQDDCFYEWISFKKFNFTKVLAVTAFGNGFACLGVHQSLEKKLMVLPSMNSVLEDYTFNELKSTISFSFYLINLSINISNTVFKNKLSPTEEVLLVSDRFSGRTYLCTKNGRCLIHQSSIFLISTLHFSEKECLMLCFENGKLFFYFYNQFNYKFIVHLPKKVSFIEKCCCFDYCLLWSDGINLHHTKLMFVCDQPFVKLSHLKLLCVIESPVSLLRINHYAITVTLNNIYYLISVGQNAAVKITKQPKELLSQISKNSADVSALEIKTDMCSHYLYCKDIIQKNSWKEKIEMRCENNLLIIKSFLRICLKQKFWKVRLKLSEIDKELVHLVSLESDVNEGMFITIENPFKGKGNVKVSLIGNFDGNILLLELGTLESSNSHFEQNNFSKHLKSILKRRNPLYEKELTKKKE